MNLFEYLDRKNQRKHLKKIINSLNEDARAARQCLVEDKDRSEKNLLGWTSIIRDIEVKADYYENKLNKLL